MMGAGRGGLRPTRPIEINLYVHVHVDDVDQHFEQAKQFSVRILSGPPHQPFGERQYTAEDLAGHLWTFAQCPWPTWRRRIGARQQPKTRRPHELTAHRISRGMSTPGGSFTAEPTERWNC